MPQTRREFIAAGAALGCAAALPSGALAAEHSPLVVATPAGDLAIHVVSHASFVMETPMGTLAVDPVGDPVAYGALPAPDAVLVTHHHGDHYNTDVLNALMAGGAPLLCNPTVYQDLPADLRAGASAITNGESAELAGVGVEAIPAYNITPERLNFHPQGRDNGYVLDLGMARVYISGDTEDIPEMRSLTGIDLAFVCMNLPFTMTAEAAADAVRAFRPSVVFPYHYRGRDGGTQDPAHFAGLVGDASEVRMGPWYG